MALAGLPVLPASTIGAVVRRWQLPRLGEVDRVMGESIRSRATTVRYARDRQGELLHVDVKKLDRVPYGGGWRLHGRSEAVRGRGTAVLVHVAVDHTPRIAYAEVLPDEKGITCARFLHRAAQWFHDAHGVWDERVLTDNAKSYRDSLGTGSRSARRCRSSAGSSSPAARGQRQGRAVQPHAAKRVGLLRRLARQHPAHRRLARLPRALQHSTRPLRCRRPTADQPTRRLSTVNDVPGSTSGPVYVVIGAI